MEQWTFIIGYLLFFFVLIYFLVVRPQQKQQKKRQEMLNSLKVNDSVVTIGGIHGRIVKLKDDSIILRIADKVEVEFEKEAVARIKGKE